MSKRRVREVTITFEPLVWEWLQRKLAQRPDLRQYRRGALTRIVNHELMRLAINAPGQAPAQAPVPDEFGYKEE